MKVRKALAIICYTVCIAACAAAGVVSYMAYRQTITYTLGFLLFMPIWIGAFWFLNFFNDLCRKKEGDKTRYVIKKSLAKALGITANLMSILLLCFWVYVYIFRIMPVEKGGTDKNGDPFSGAAIMRSMEDIAKNDMNGGISWQMTKK